MAVKGDELVKYITQQVVAYMETPKDIKRQHRRDRRTRRREEPWTHRWFGMLPLSFGMLLGQKKSGSHEEPDEE